MSEAWLKMEAHVLGQGIAKGEIDPVLLTEAYLAAIHDHPHRDRIFARTTEARAMAEARSARARAGSGPTNELTLLTRLRRTQPL